MKKRFPELLQHPPNLLKQYITDALSKAVTVVIRKTPLRPCSRWKKTSSEQLHPSNEDKFLCQVSAADILIMLYRKSQMGESKINQFRYVLGQHTDTKGGTGVTQQRGDTINSLTVCG